MHTTLPKIISALHSACVPHRDTHDYILMTHDILSSFNKRHLHRGYITIKLDKKNVYDRLDWILYLGWWQMTGRVKQCISPAF